MHHEAVRIPRSPTGDHGVFSEVSDESRGLRSKKGRCVGFHFPPPKKMPRPVGRVGRAESGRDKETMLELDGKEHSTMRK